MQNALLRAAYMGQPLQQAPQMRQQGPQRAAGGFGGLGMGQQQQTGFNAPSYPATGRGAFTAQPQQPPQSQPQTPQPLPQTPQQYRPPAPQGGQPNMPDHMPAYMLPWGFVPEPWRNSYPFSQYLDPEQRWAMEWASQVDNRRNAGGSKH